MQLEQIQISGVYLPVLLVCLGGAGIVYFVIRCLFAGVGVYRFFWHPALAGAAVYTLIASLFVLWLVP